MIENKIKPIFIIRFQYSYNIEKIKEQIEILNRSIGNDYHILFTKDYDRKEVGFECYNSKCTEIELKELQDKVLKQINNE